jgi:anhydro-N-acetylmuramic acid kinase
MDELARLKGSEPLSVIGLMSGTSMDGIDAAWVETDGHVIAAHGPSLTIPYDPAFRARLHRFVAAVPDKHHPQAGALEAALTDLHAAAVKTLSAQVGRAPDAVGFHGQTVWHRPHLRQTWQIGDGQRLARALKLPVVFDFRSADVASGGQGAPLLPLFHAQIVAERPKPIVVANIGGVANITWLGEARPQAGAARFPFAILGFDTGPGNALLDDWMLKHTGQVMDRDARTASAGRVDAARLHKLLAAPFFAAPPPKSLDRLAFDVAVLEGLSVADGAATLVEFTAASIAKAIAQCPTPPRHVLVTGGGRHNPLMMARLKALTGLPIDPIEAVGCDGDVIEAQAFGYFAVRSLRGLPLTYPEITGAPRPLTGGRLALA